MASVGSQVTVCVISEHNEDLVDIFLIYIVCKEGYIFVKFKLALFLSVHSDNLNQAANVNNSVIINRPIHYFNNILEYIYTIHHTSRFICCLQMHTIQTKERIFYSKSKASVLD